MRSSSGDTHQVLSGRVGLQARLDADLTLVLGDTEVGRGLVVTDDRVLHAVEGWL